MLHNAIRFPRLATAFLAVSAAVLNPRALSSQAAVRAPRLRRRRSAAQQSRHRTGRLATDRAFAGERETRGRFLPSLSLDSRYSRQSRTLDLGDIVNPAYAALNQVDGGSCVSRRFRAHTSTGARVPRPADPDISTHRSTRAIRCLDTPVMRGPSGAREQRAASPRRRKQAT